MKQLRRVQKTRGRTHTCPVCAGTGKLTEAQYQRLTRNDAQRTAFKAKIRDLESELENQRALQAKITRLESAAKKHDADKKTALEQQAAAFAKREEEIRRDAAMKERERLAKTPRAQSVALMQEVLAVERLRKRFPNWQWERKGQAGDIHGTLHDRKTAIGNLTIEIKAEDVLSLANRRDARKARGKTIPDRTILATFATKRSSGRPGVRSTTFCGFEGNGRAWRYFDRQHRCHRCRDRRHRADLSC